ncbi:LysR family transcriptional regulator [Hoeflea marina]|uniref:LysR family transcriptional regulator n=1 Tax=Hoeflea marina TaxID=274592 RepID=A0A317PT12_9HYPH|nr:LysR family transcriptional regulator [Hoeflea marina]PWW03376.1 LysR family transcriptional regulator [Hoeflea marina]
MNAASRLSLKQLQVFSALLKSGNLSHVADQIGLTQQAVSANLAVLRDIFGDPLFTRTGRGVAPTALAKELGVEVSAILLALDLLVARAPFDPAQIEATVTISAADYAHAVAIAPQLGAIRRQAPKLKIILSELEVDAVVTKMASGQVDIVVTIPQFVPDTVPRRTILREHYVCVTAAGSPLAGQRISLATLVEQQHVVVSPARANLIGSADDWLKRCGLTRNIILSVPHFLLLPLVVEATGAVAFVPSRLLPNPHLVRLMLDGDVTPPGFEVVAAWHPRSATSPLIGWLVSMLAGTGFGEP